MILLDNILAQYGPETRTARELLRRAIAPMADSIWLENGLKSTKQGPFEATAASEAAYAEIQHLSPQSDVQRSLKTRALDISSDLAQTRLLLFEQTGNAIPIPFLAVLVFWLAIIFASFSLFSRLNATLIAALLVFASSRSPRLSGPRDPPIFAEAASSLAVEATQCSRSSSPSRDRCEGSC